MAAKYIVPKLQLGGTTTALNAVGNFLGTNDASEQAKLQAALQRRAELQRARDSGERPDLVGMGDDQLMQIAMQDIERDGLLGTDSAVTGVGEGIGAIGAVTNAAIAGDVNASFEEKAFAGGASAFGNVLAATQNPLLAGVAGVGAGLFSGVTGEAKKFDAEEMERRSGKIKRFNVPADRSTGIFAEDGGKVEDGDPEEDTIIPVQTEKLEKGETIYDPEDGSVVLVHAEKSHGQMKDTEVTDNIKEGVIIFPERKRIRVGDLKIPVGMTEGNYSEHKSERDKSEVVTIEDFGVKAGDRFSEASTAIAKKYKTVQTGAFNELDKITNSENLNSRKVALDVLHALNEQRNAGDDSLVADTVNPEIFKDGGLARAGSGGPYRIEPTEDGSFNIVDNAGNVVATAPNAGLANQELAALQAPLIESRQVNIDHLPGTNGGVRDENALSKQEIISMGIPRASRTKLTLNAFDTDIDGIVSDAPNVSLDRGKVTRPADISTLPFNGVVSNVAPRFSLPSEDSPLDTASGSPRIEAFTALLNDAANANQIAQSNVATERVGALADANSFFDTQNSRNALSTIASILGNNAITTEVLPNVTKPVLAQGLRPQQIKAAQETAGNANAELVRQLNESGQGASNALSAAAVAAGSEAAGQVGGRAVAANAQIGAENDRARVISENANNAAIVAAQNATNINTNIKAQDAISIFTAAVDARTSSDANRLETNADINTSFDEQMRSLQTEQIKLQTEFSRNEITRAELEAGLDRIDELQKILNERNSRQ